MRLGLAGRATFRCADWFQDIEGMFDLVVSNPPYIAEAEMADLAPEVAAGLGAAFTAAVASASVAAHAHHDFDLAACTGKHSPPQWLVCHCDSRHRRTRSGPECVQRSDPHLWI